MRSVPARAPRWLAWRQRVQAGAFILANSWLLQRFTPSKGICFPVLNCWACPGANFACPIGAIQNGCASARLRLAGGAPLWDVIPIYTLGTLVFFAAIFGRMMCGWLCPFGWFQELVGRLRKSKARLPRWTSYLRYLVLVGLVIIVPYYTGDPWFTKLCPQGALEGGIPQPLINPSLRPLMGDMWYIKQVILVGCVIAFVFYKRPFCGVICPLGAIFSLFNRFSLWEIRFAASACVNCLWCVRNCPQAIDPRAEVNGHACISCLNCVRCPYGAITQAPIWAPQRQPLVRSGDDAAAPSS